MNLRFCVVFFGVCLAELNAGMFLGWTSPITPELLDHKFSFKLTENEACWTVYLFNIGMAVGCFLSIFLLDALGRKVLILLTIFPSVLSWLLIIWTPSIWDLYSSRFIAGIASGVIFTSGAIYVTEISPVYLRSALCSCFLLMNYFGSLIGHIISSNFSMEISSYVAIFLVAVQFIVFVWVPDSPYFLLYRKQLCAGMDSLIYMRGSADVSLELESIMKSVEPQPQYTGTQNTVSHLISRTNGKRAVIIGASLMVLQVFSGTNVLVVFSRTIFEKIDSIHLNGSYTNAVLAIIVLISCFLCISSASRLGKRPLLIISTVSVAGSCFLLGIYFFLERHGTDLTDFRSLAFGIVLFYSASVSVGLTSLPFVIMTEIFPMYAKTVCVGFGFCIHFLLCFTILLIWETVMNANCMDAGFWLFSVVNLFSNFFLVFYLPETGGQSLQVSDSPVARVGER